MGRLRVYNPDNYYVMWHFLEGMGYKNLRWVVERSKHVRDKGAQHTFIEWDRK